MDGNILMCGECGDMWDEAYGSSCECGIEKEKEVKDRSNDFSLAKVRDKVWTPYEGDTTIIKITDNNRNYRQIETEGAYYRMDGKANHTDNFQTLFWSNPFEGIELPQPPKRKIKRRLEELDKEPSCGFKDYNVSFTKDIWDQIKDVEVEVEG